MNDVPGADTEQAERKPRRVTGRASASLPPMTSGERSTDEKGQSDG